MTTGESAVESADSEGSELSSEAMKEALQQAQEKAAEHWDRLLRKEAEFQNFQKRSRDDLAQTKKFAIENFARELLVVLDTFERGLESAQQVTVDVSALVEGMQLTHKLLLDILEKFQVTPVNPVAGAQFDPALHQAIFMQETAEWPSNMVLSVAQKGYLIHGRLLRAAQVVVSKALSVDTAEASGD